MDVGALQRRITGSVVQRTHPAYEPVRRALVWNELKPERYPELIVHAASEADVVATVEFARVCGLRIAVRGGGHSWCAAALRDGSILLDLARLDAASIDAAARTAVVQPVVRNRELAQRLGAHRLAFPLGHCSSVPVSGYLLGGGFGWNAGMWGPACFSVRALDVVTADGRLRHGSSESEPDLFWAARGAGPGFFGVVTRFHLQVYPLPHTISTSTYVYPLEELPAVVEWVNGAGPALSPAVEVALLLSAAPPQVTEGRVGDRPVCTVTATAFVDTPAAAATALAPLEDAPLAHTSLWSETRRATTFDGLYDDLDRFFPERHRYIADTVWSNTPGAEVLGAVRNHVAAAPSRKSLVLCAMPPPPPADAPAMPDAAFSMVGATFVLCYAIWEEARDDAANRAWHERAMQLLEPFATGHYLGESDIVATPSRARGSFKPANWERLRAVRNGYDPDGLFHGFFPEP